jgi:hypothetical protein
MLAGRGSDLDSPVLAPVDHPRIVPAMNPGSDDLRIAAGAGDAQAHARAVPAELVQYRATGGAMGQLDGELI